MAALTCRQKIRWTAPCSASVGAYRKIAAPATSISPTAAAAARSYLLIQYEPRRERREHEEQYVEVHEQSHRLVVAAAGAHRDLHRLPARDDERNPQRQREERKQQLAPADAPHHRGEKPADRGHPDAAHHHPPHHLPPPRPAHNQPN